MKVSGFTLVRNGVRFDYPFEESLRSLLPLVDELVVNVGIGDDETLARVRTLEASAEAAGKLRVFESRWPLDDPERKKSGLILSEQTNLAMDRCTGDWCVYLQADEVLHEGDLPRVREALSRADSDPAVEALVFDYVHFYGSYGVVQRSRSAYRREVRAVRRASGARSVGDAQGFLVGGAGGRKLAAARAGGARVFHYGWVRPPETMREKTFFMDQLYHGAPRPEDAAAGRPHTGENYRYKRIWGLERFVDSHPAVMHERVARAGLGWDFAGSRLIWGRGDLSKIALDLVERATGVRLFEHRGYRLV